MGALLKHDAEGKPRRRHARSVDPPGARGMPVAPRSLTRSERHIPRTLLFATVAPEATS
jgi:hypothetical protein